MSFVEATRHNCIHAYWVSCLRFYLIQSDMIVVLSWNMLSWLRSKNMPVAVIREAECLWFACSQIIDFVVVYCVRYLFCSDGSEEYAASIFFVFELGSVGCWNAREEEVCRLYMEFAVHQTQLRKRKRSYTEPESKLCFLDNKQPFSGPQIFRNVLVMWHYLPEFFVLAVAVGEWYGSPSPMCEPVSPFSEKLMPKLCPWKPSNAVFPNILLSEIII